MDDGMMIRGPQYGGVGTFTPRTASQTGAQRVAPADGRYFDPVHQRQVYYAANQTATTWSVALNTTFTGLVLSNPEGSGMDLVVLAAGFALSVAPVGIASMGFFGGYLAAGITTHTTPLTPGCTYLRAANAACNGKADAAATLVGTPVWLLPFMGGFTAGALPGVGPAMLDLGGLFIIPPGAYFGIGALTAVIGFGAILWEEINNAAL